MNDRIKVSFIGMEPTDSITSYLMEKVTKHQNMLEPLTNGTAFLKEYVSSRGTEKDFKIELNLYFPGSTIHVEERGSDMYAIIDLASDTLFRRLKRYHDRNRQWEGSEPWKIIEAQEELKALEEDMGEDVTSFEDYAPKIVSRKVMETMRPMEEAEAIERMELGGYEQYLFKRKDGKIAMVYKRKASGFGLVEQGDTDSDLA